MKQKFTTGLVAISLLLALSCSKEEAKTSNAVNAPNAINLSGTGTSLQSAGLLDNENMITFDEQEQGNRTAKSSSTWILRYDWNCNGGPSSGLMTFYSDGTWSSPDGFVGYWVQLRGMVMWDFENSTNPKVTYSGNILSNTKVQGIMSSFIDGTKGCFDLERTTDKNNIKTSASGIGADGNKIK